MATRAEPGEPRSVYRMRLDEERRRADVLRRVERRFSWARLVLFAAAAALVWPALFARTVSALWLLVPVAGFLILVVWHERVVRTRTRAERIAAHYEHGLARLDDRWAGRGNPGLAYGDRDHPYASDLDLFGTGSLFELLCGARTATGAATLARWLLEPAPAEEIRRRQQAVDELRPRLDLREDLAVLGAAAAAGVDAADLLEWSAGGPLLAGRAWCLLAALLAGCNVAALAALPLFDWAGTALLVTLGASAAFALALRPRVHRVLATIERPERELELLALVLRRLERERFRCARLVDLRAALDTAGDPPSRRIAKLARLVQTAASRHNMLFAPLAAVLLLGTQLAYAVERWRATSGAAVRRWVEATGELEALCSLAGYAYERPADPFPEIVESGPCFDARALGHPLIPDARCVRNDVRLGGELRLLLVSGSNMSGKSTLLRTVGVASVLGQAGAPVRAAALRLSPLAVGASMRVFDSLQEGRSHFYAEVHRLRGLVELGRGERPLLFLLDELFHGTNSHDRRIGAEALIRGLVEDGGIGLVTTHDLALAEVARMLGPRAANVHFEDHLVEGRISFDYRLRAGVVRKSNALELMRAVGLEV